MTDEERVAIVKALANINMRGYPWVGAAVCDELQKHLPVNPSWQLRLNQYLGRGYKRRAEE